MAEVILSLLTHVLPRLRGLPYFEAPVSVELREDVTDRGVVFGVLPCRSVCEDEPHSEALVCR